MRTVLLTVGLTILVPNIAQADDAVATKVVNEAVEATANSDLRLQRLQNIVRTEKGTFFFPDGDAPARRTAYLGPERIKFDAIVTRGGQPQPIVLSISGVRGWTQSNGSVHDLSVAEHDSVVDEADAWSLVTLLGVRKKGVTLKSLPPMTVNGKAAVGVNVTRPNRPDAQLYFAADTGIPLKVKVKTREAGKEVNREIDLAVYRDFTGIKLPTRITLTQNGRKIEDWTVQNYDCPEKLDEKLFVKPK